MSFPKKTLIAEAVIEIFPAYTCYLQPARFKVAYGGRGSAKTRTFVTLLLNNVLYYGWRAVCFREIMKSLDDSVYQEFIDEIERRGLEAYFKPIKNKIKCLYSGGLIAFDGLLRNKQKVKGYANFDCAWIEEAENVSEESWKFLIPTLRKETSEIWVSYNPDNILSATHQMFVINCHYPEQINGKNYCIVRKINYTDNPRFPETLRLDAELMKENDYELYRHVYLGEPVANSELAIIKPMWIEAALNSHKKLKLNPGGGKFVGFDVADEGDDKNAMAARFGWLVPHVEEWRDRDPNSAAVYVFNETIRNKVDLVRYDNIGVGAGAKGAIRDELRKIEAAEMSHKVKLPSFVGYTANASVAKPNFYYMPGKKNIDMFHDLSSQDWWLLADRFKNTYNAVNGKPYDPDKLISIDEDSIDAKLLQKLMAELSQPRRDYINGKFKKESKKDMRKRGVASTNLADAVVMAFASDSNFSLKLSLIHI